MRCSSQTGMSVMSMRGDASGGVAGVSHLKTGDAQVEPSVVSELCRIPSEVPVKHRD